MADTKVSALTSLTKSTVATNDVLPIVDTSATTTKKITYQELLQPLDSQFRVAGSSDSTKLLAFEVDGFTTATTRTVTVPDADLTLVGLTTTQTLTNKTLTSPQINFGSDATGDIIYRTSGGVTARLAIGTSGNILQVSSGGIPEWVTNPAAADASTTVKGVVEIATSAEIAAGTSLGGTGAKLVVPADAVAQSGADKILKLDSSGRLPALDGSLLTGISTSSISGMDLYNGVGAATGTKTYLKFNIPYLITTDVPLGNLWSRTGDATISSVINSVSMTSGSDIAQALLTTNAIAYNSTNDTTLKFSSGKDVIVEFAHKVEATGSEQIGWGLSNIAAPFSDYDDQTADAVCFTIDAAGAIYGHTSSAGSGHTESALSGVTATNLNIYRIEFSPGVDAKFYVNGVLKATISTNLPSGATAIKFGFGSGGNTSNNQRHLSITPNFAVEI